MAIDAVGLSKNINAKAMHMSKLSEFLLMEITLSVYFYCFRLRQWFHLWM